MFALDSLVIDLVFGANTRPTPEQLLAGIGGEEVVKNRTIVDVDLDVPQFEAELSPTVPLRRRGERRLLIVDESVAPLRKNPRQEPIVARDLRSEKQRLLALVVTTGARFGRMNALGTWGDAVVVVRSARDLRGLMLLGTWMLDPLMDLEGRRRASPLNQREVELKMSMFDKRLDELDDMTILSRVSPGRVERLVPKGKDKEKDGLLVVDLLSDRDGSWDIRKSYEMETRVAAVDLFSRIPGARQAPIAPAAEAPAPAAAPAPPPPPPEPEPVGPAVQTGEVEGRIILRIPAERFDLNAITALGARGIDWLRRGDAVSGKDRDRIHQHGCGFLAPLAYLSEVFIEGKPLDRRLFEAQAREVAPGARALEAHLPRFGPVRVLDIGGKRYVTSEPETAAAQLIPLAAGLV